MLIARLIADPDQVETRLDSAIAALRECGIPVAMARMLEHDGGVLHISSPGGSSGEGGVKAFRDIIEREIRPSAGMISTADIDIPKLFISDMDSTMIGQECIDELADFAGLKSRIADITERAMQGEIDFESALRERVALLGGLDESAISRCLTERIRAMGGARILVKTLKSKGCRTVLVTGGFHHFADVVAAEIGFERVVGNRLAVDNGKLTGGLDGPIVDSGTKLAVLEEERGLIGGLIKGAKVLAAGDGANDIPMLEAADYGFAFRAKPKARSAASAWIDQGDLTVILQLLGIPRREWAG